MIINVEISSDNLGTLQEIRDIYIRSLISKGFSVDIDATDALTTLYGTEEEGSVWLTLKLSNKV